MDKKYIPNIDYNTDIYSQNIMYETIVILSIIYRDYLCTSEEKENMIRNDKLELENIRQKEQQQYHKDVFEKVREQTERKIEENTQEIALVEIKKDKWYMKIINKIKKFFGFNK